MKSYRFIQNYHVVQHSDVYYVYFLLKLVCTYHIMSVYMYLCYVQLYTTCMYNIICVMY